MRIWRDAAGTVINIGEWDFQPDADGAPQNPLPDGAWPDEADVIEGADGGRYVAADHASLRKAAYPPIAEQLDALWKGGDAREAMRARVQAVKAAYPKAAR
jgi:hypothetical protein